MEYSTLVERAKQEKYCLLASWNGVCLKTRHYGGNNGGARGKRGNVKGFSKSSARRFRHFLMKVDYTGAVAVTLTHPSPCDTSLYRLRGPESSFDSLRRDSVRLPFIRSLIWRKEVQSSGMPHYHCVLIPAEGFEGITAGRMLVDSWIDYCLFGFPRPFQNEAANDEIEDDIRRRMIVAHSDPERPSVCIFSNRNGYLRYILDHDSKHKEYQARTSGRPWGVWFRRALPLLPFDFESLTKVEYNALARCLRKVSRYKVNDSRAPFGWYHSRGRRARGGCTDYFARINDGSLSRDVFRLLYALRA